MTVSQAIGLCPTLRLCEPDPEGVPRCKKQGDPECDEPDPVCLPDGLCVDAEGCLWVAFWGGWNVKRFSATGEEIGEISLPVSQVTSCAFGGPELTDLYITTARVATQPDELAQKPLAGSLFRVSLACRGVPSVRFARAL